MRPEIQPFAAVPGRLDADSTLLLTPSAAAGKRNFQIWTSSRLLKRFGVPWHLPEQKPLLHRVDTMLRELESRGLLVRRAQKQTSRNTRDEWAYEIAPDDAGA